MRPSTHRLPLILLPVVVIYAAPAAAQSTGLQNRQQQAAPVLPQNPPSPGLGGTVVTPPHGVDPGIVALPPKPTAPTMPVIKPPVHPH